MIDIRNPYTPGAGTMPRTLAGRERVLTDAERKVRSVQASYPARSVVYFGLRGVGKTVVLNAIEDTCEKLDILVRYIETEEQKSVITALSSACSTFMLELSPKEALKAKWQKSVAVLKSFNVRWNPSDSSFELGLGSDSPLTSAAGTGDLSNDFTEVLVALGKYAREAQAAICFCVDELQYAPEHELEALVAALHRSNQLGLPIIFFCAGLPKIRKTLGDAKSYAERLFEFIEIDSLNSEAATKAICEPAEKLGVRYSPDAVQAIISYTGGYPYFIQEMCSVIWDNGKEGASLIEEADVNASVTSVNEKLDAGFFSVRFDRCTPREKEFLQAMAACGNLPCTLDCVAKRMHTEKRKIGPFRANLINKGLIYATGRNEVDFTVPQFSTYLERQHRVV